MSVFVVLIAALLFGILGTTAYFIASRRRLTPRLDIEMDCLPELHHGVSTIAGLTAASVYRGNAASVFQDGSIFPAMIQDIRAAQHTVHLESFVWTAGELEREFVDLLTEKSRSGVKVRVLIDAIGSNGADQNQLNRLVSHGVELVKYCRPHWWNLRRLNHRTHRKLLIVDGSVGYTFGHGISDQWVGHGEDRRYWRDTGVRLEGPVVQGLQSVFMENWIEETHCVPCGEGCFPDLPVKGTVDAHVVYSDAGEAISAVSLLYTLAIASAKREIVIQNPYFVPGTGVVKLLKRMVTRGVAVHLMVPGRHTDSHFVRSAGHHLYAGLLEAGVRLYEYEPTLLHQKTVVVDDIWSHIGSTNFDARSLALNEECGVGLVDAGIAAELKTAFNRDLEHSHEMTLERWRERSWRHRVADWFAYQMHEQL